jgi:DNA-binding NarL/FixJ family response regulator
MRPDSVTEGGSGRRPAAEGTGDDALQILLVDDHTLFRTGLRHMLVEHGFDVVEARNGELAVQLAAKIVPDVVLMDLHMPVMSGVEATRRITGAEPSTRVVMLTVSADHQDVVDAVLAGACGYLLKDAPMEEIVASVRAAASGASWVSPRVAGLLLERVREAGESPEHGPVGAELTEREREILRLVAEGKDNTEIAEQLVLSPKTVKNHVSSILAKLQMENRIQAAVYAVRRGLA